MKTRRLNPTEIAQRAVDHTIESVPSIKEHADFTVIKMYLTMAALNAVVEFQDDAIRNSLKLTSK